MVFRPKIQLRTIFLIFSCAAIGLTCATVPPEKADPALSFIPTPRLNYYFALLYSASFAMVVGLFSQARDLFQSRPSAPSQNGELRFARALAILWRTCIAFMLIVCMFAHLLIARRILSLPDHNDIPTNDIFPDTFATILVVFVLTQCFARWRYIKRSAVSHGLITVLAGIAGLLLALIVLPDAGLVMYLVHVALSGIEAFQPGRFHRLDVYPDPRADGFRFFWLSLGAVAGWIAAATILLVANSLHTGNKRVIACGVAMIALLAGDIAFCVWFFTKEFHHVSIDMASVGFAANWFDWTTAGILTAMLGSVGAYRLSLFGLNNAERAIPVPALKKTYAHESAWFLVLLVGSMVAYYIDELRIYMNMPTFFGISSGLMQFASSVLYYSDGYLQLGILTLCIQLFWTRWKRQAETPDWKLLPVSHVRFGWNWFAVVLLVVVGIPTIGIYCFAFWFGPWNLYGPK